MVQYSPLDTAFAALADPTRRAVLERLVGGEPASVTELAAPFSMSLTGMKKHIHVLEQAELITTDKVGRTRICRAGPRNLEDVTTWIDAYRSTLLGRMDRFAAILEREKENRS